MIAAGGTAMHWMLMPLRRYAEFTGRSRRQEYWMYVLFMTLVYVGLLIVLGAMASFDADAFDPKSERIPAAAIPVLLFIVLLYLGFFIPTLAVQVRRFHDQDLSGWFALLGFIPYLGWLIILIFMCIEGTAGPNRFGPDPKGRGESQADVFA